jgi:hypothetical protein
VLASGARSLLRSEWAEYPPQAGAQAFYYPSPTFKTPAEA